MEQSSESLESSEDAAVEDRGLEQRVSELEKKAEEFGVDEYDYEGEDTINGAVVLPYHINDKTGKLEVLLEQVPRGYDEEGKIKIFGGAQKTTDKSDSYTAMREIKEEIKEPAASIITERLNNNGYIIDIVSYFVNGKMGYIVVYGVEIKGRNEWEMVKRAITQHDGGIPRVLGEDRVIKTDNGYFAYQYGQVIKGVIAGNSTARFN